MFSIEICVEAKIVLKVGTNTYKNLLIIEICLELDGYVIIQNYSRYQIKNIHFSWDNIELNKGHLRELLIDFFSLKVCVTEEHWVLI